MSNTSQTPEQLARNPHAILLRNAVVDTARRAGLGIPKTLRSQGAPGGYLAQSDRPLNAEFYAALRQAGAVFISYIPNNAALVQATPDQAKALVANRVFQAVLPYEPYFKLDDSLLPAAVNGDLLTNNQLRVTAYPGQADAAEQALKAMGACVMGREPSPFGSTTLLATVPPDRLVAVAQLPQTQEIETFSSRVKACDLTRVNMGIAPSPVALTNYLGLTGTNIVLVLDDTGVDTTHPDFAGAGARIFGMTNDPDGHGTHDAGIMIGGGNESATVTNSIPGSGVPSTNQFRGMAPQASLLAQGVDMATGPYISDSFLQSNASFILTAMARTNTALPTNGFINDLPWGYQGTTYDLSAASYDLATRNSQPGTNGEHAMLFVVAAGNNGPGAGSITSPGTAKNVYTVSAVDSPRYVTNIVMIGTVTNAIFQSTTFDSNQVPSFSSAGNVDAGLEGGGGRFKPDGLAPGVFIVAPRATNWQDPAEQQILNYATLTGQSVSPGQSNVYVVNIFGGTTNLAIQVAPNAFSPVPFPTNLQIYISTNFGTNSPPGTNTLVTTTNEAGVAVVTNMTNLSAANCYIEILSPTNQPWPVAYDLRVYGIETNALGDYYTVLSNLNSALSPYYRYESGTSAAASVASGMLALMQQYLVGTLHMTPSPALLKGLMINGSRPLNAQSQLSMAPGVNSEGWGLPNLSNCIPASLNPTNLNPSMVFFDQSPTNALQTGQWHNYTVGMADVNASNFPLRITLVWTDPPGNPAAGKALVNDLDLVVTDSQSNVYIGNDFQYDPNYTAISPSGTNDPSDTVNNVENVFIDSTFGLLPPYTVSVRGARVNVNAATLQTNGICQDYALIIATDDTALASPLTVTDNGIINAATNTALITSNVANAQVLLHQRVGANEPNLDQYPGGLYTAAQADTNGSLVQWHFFSFPNINYQMTNTSAFNFTVTNIVNGTTNITTNLASQYTNAVFLIFLPPTLTIPISSPVNGSYPAADNSDLDLYVSTNSALFSLDPGALDGAEKALGQGGTKMVLFTNIASVSNFYVGVKSESQQAGDFAFFAALTTNFTGPNDDGSVTVSAVALPVAIPDSLDEYGSQGASVIAVVASSMTVRKVSVTLGIDHQEPAELNGVLTHNQETAVLNHLTGAPGGFTNTYDDLPEGWPSSYPIIPSDGPANLRNFVGQQAAGPWILDETDTAFTQTGMVTMLTLTVWPEPPISGNGLNSTNYINLPTNGSYYGYIDVPDDATNLNIALSYQGSGSAGIYLTNQEVPNTGDYGTNIVFATGVTNFSLNLSTFPPPNPPYPLLSGGRWYYVITNEGAALTNIMVVITIEVSVTPNLTLTEASATNTPLTVDGHTQSQIFITNGLLSSNQQLASLQVGVVIANTNLDDLVLTLTSPQGTSVQLFEDRGGTGATNMGLVTSNGYIYMYFTDDSILASQLVKFFPPPYGQLPTNVNVFVSSFETVGDGDYGQTNTIFPATLGTNLEGWTVVANDVAVVGNEDLYQAYGGGSNYLALANGEITANLTTVPGQAYTLTHVYRGPGLVDWWPFNTTSINPLIGTNNGTVTGGLLTIVQGEVMGGAIQFPNTPAGATINFGANAGNFGTNDFTIDYWMKTSSTNSGEAFLQQGSACDSSNFWQIEVGGGPNGNPAAGVPWLSVGNGTNHATLTCTTNLNYTTTNLNYTNWHHLAWVRRGVNLSLYVDGTNNNQTNLSSIYNLSNGLPLIMGTNDCTTNGSVPYTGAAQALDIWNRALTDVEVAAIFEAGANGMPKATAPWLPNCEILLNSVGYTNLVAPDSGTNWLTNTLYFTAVQTNTTLTLQGNPLGMLFDDFVLQTLSSDNYVQPEESLEPLTGENPYGVWTLDVWDTRTDSSAPTNGVLVSWDLQMTVSSTNVNLIVLTNDIAYTAGTVPPNGIAYFAFDVTNYAIYATNILTNCSTNLSLLFNQVSLPTGSELGDYTLFAGVTNGTYVLAIDTPPPALLPGARYFLGVQNTNTVAATFTIEVKALIKVVFGSGVVTENKFTLNWVSVPGIKYEIQVSSDLIHWTNAGVITTDGETGAFTDPDPISKQSARFYKVVPSQ